MILDVTTTIHSGSEFDNKESTVAHLFLKTPLPPAGSSDDHYEWKITESTRGAMDHSRSSYSQSGSGSYTLVIPEITITYALQRDDSTTNEDTKRMGWVYQPARSATTEGTWLGGGFTKSTLEITDGDSAAGSGSYTFPRPGGGGGGIVSTRTIQSTRCITKTGT